MIELLAEIIEAVALAALLIFGLLLFVKVSNG